MKKWEYMEYAAFIFLTSEEEVYKGRREEALRLKELGKEGWELVSVNIEREAGKLLIIYYHFKRPLEGLIME